MIRVSTDKLCMQGQGALGQIDKDEVMAEFFAECDEILERFSSNLTQLEAGNASSERLDELYRDMHTLKGSAQLFGLTQLGWLGHAVEACLDPVRKFQCSPSPALLDALFASINGAEEIIQNLKMSAQTPADFTVPMISKLIEAACAQFANEFELDRESVVLGELLNFKTTPQTAKPIEVAKPLEIAKPIEAAMPSQPEKKVKNDNADDVNSKGSGDSGSSGDSSDSSIRVQVGLLDNLMNLVGEMVLVRNQVLQHSSRSEDLAFLNLSQRLDVVTSELQDQVMRTRMQPIGNVLTKFQRVIRDLAKELDKKIDLTVQGKDTELDKTLLEAIKDPLTHIVRNSCDHGVETTADRLKAGKPETGHVLISAFHEGGQVIVEISDDGRGMNRQKLVHKAIERGILTTETAEKISDNEKLQLIFHPGFSTAAQVSAVSGRGVGMDVVKTNIEKIGGSVEVASVEGKGSTIRLKIPLTLAIVPAMLVRCSDAEYAIPQVKLVELVRVEQDGVAESKIQFVQGKPVYELRGRLLPLIDMRDVLARRQTSKAELSKNQNVNIVVLNADGDLYGLIVDEVLDTADIVVKPLTKFLKSLEVYSAATILGSGKVALIIDPMGLAKAGGVVFEKKQAETDYLRSTSAKEASDAQEFLLFRTKASGKYAIPLCMVSRLEEFARDGVEYSGEQMVMRYRDSILPLIDVSETLGFGQTGTGVSKTLPTIVVTQHSRAYGIMVEEILDVTDCDALIDDSIRDRFGLLGNVVIGNEIINVIDALSIIDKESIRMGGESLKAAIGTQVAEQTAVQRRILFAEDVAFFRRQTAKILMGQGFEVFAVEDGKKALDLLTSKDVGYFDLILSDIEMPNMNGMNFARAARQTDQGKTIPMVALTTRFKQSDIDEGLSAGFNTYLEKLNPEVLVKSMNDLFATKKGKAA